MKKRNRFFFVTLFALMLITGCGRPKSKTPQVSGKETIENDEKETDSTETGKTESEYAGMKNEAEDDQEMKMNIGIGEYSFTATMEDNAAVKELIQMAKEAPVTIEMSDYSGFEKVGALGRNLTTSNRQLTTGSGDIVLYNGNNIVIFYGSNSWSYTKLGRIDDLTLWEEALGNGDVTVTFAIAE